MTSRGMLTAASLPSRPRRRSRLHRQAEDTFLAGPLVGPFELLAVPNATPSRRHFAHPHYPFSKTGGAGPVTNQFGEALTPLCKRAGQPSR